MLISLTLSVKTTVMVSSVLCSLVFGVWVEPKDGARVALFPGAEEGKQKEHLVHTVSTRS